MREIIYEKDKINIDEGLFFGRGVFETIYCKEYPVFLNRHIRRLQEALKILELPDIDEKKLLEYLKTLEIKDSSLKITVTPKNIILNKRPLPYKKEDYIEGAKLVTTKLLRNSTSRLTYIKWIGYFENILEKRKAKELGYTDALFLNEKGYVAETSCANIFIVKDNNIYTPKIEDGILNGIIRGWIIDNFQVLERNLTLQDILKADEVFITNSLMGIMPVSLINEVKYENRKYANMIEEKYKLAMTEREGV